MKYYDELLDVIKLITFDTGKKLKIRKLENIECLSIFIKSTKWLQAAMHESKTNKNGVCILDITHKTNEGIIISKKLNEFEEEELVKICNALAHKLTYEQLESLHHYMIPFVKRSVSDEAQKIFVQLQQNRNILREASAELDNDEEANDENSEVFIAALSSITIFMKDDIYKGILGATRKLDQEIPNNPIEYMDPMVNMLRKELKDDEFMRYQVGNLVVVDMENFCMFNYDDTLRMDYPYKCGYEYAEISDCGRFVPDIGPKYIEIEINKNWNGSILSDDDTLSQEEEAKDFEYRYTVDRIDGVKGDILRFKPGNKVFGKTDSVIMNEILQSEYFINYYKDRNITICKGFEEDDKVIDIINLKQQNKKLEKEKDKIQEEKDKMQEENDKMQEEIERLREENEKLKQANNHNNNQ